MGLPLPGSAASVDLFPCGSSVRQQDVQQSGHFGGVHGVVLTDTPVRAGAAFINGKLVERPGESAEPEAA